MEGSRPDALWHLGVIEHTPESFLHLVCRLVGKGDGKHVPGWAGRLDKLVKYRRDELRGVGSRFLKRGNRDLGNIRGDFLAPICVAVFDDLRYALNENCGLSASRACYNKQRPLGRKNGVALAVVEI